MYRYIYIHIHIIYIYTSCAFDRPVLDHSFGGYECSVSPQPEAHWIGLLSWLWRACSKILLQTFCEFSSQTKNKIVLDDLDNI